MRLQNFEAFILDMDGTLIDTGKYHARAFADAVLEQSGYALTPGEHHEFFASHTKPFSQVLNERYGLSLEPERVLLQKRRRMEEVFVAELFEGAREFLERWHGKKPMALATNSPLSFARPALEETGLMEYFDCITTTDEVANKKPDPEIIEITIQKLRVDPLKTLVFEDQLMGIEAARTAGAHVMAIDNGQHVEFPPDIPVATWKELLSA
ncbi:MAG: HAD family phosphatase [Verrucomicrobiota bacterium]